LSKTKYYDFEKTERETRDCYAVGIFSARTGGKTYGWKEQLVFKHYPELTKNCEEEFKENSFVYIRRRKEEMKRTAPKLFTDIMQDYNERNGTNYVIRYRNGEFQLCERNNNKLIFVKTLGCGIPLFGAEEMKTASFPNVKNIIFEEAFVKDFRKYINGMEEVDDLIDLANTIFRNRKGCRLWLIANKTSEVNPYFYAWHIEPKLGKSYYNINSHLKAGKSIKICMDFVDMDELGVKDEIEDNGFLALASEKYQDYNAGTNTLDDKETNVDMPRKIKPYVKLITKEKIFYIYAGKNIFFVSDKITPYYARERTLINGFIKIAMVRKQKFKTQVFYAVRGNTPYISHTLHSLLKRAYEKDRLKFNDFKTRMFFDNFIKNFSFFY
jgi:hypothetical protein